MCIRSLEIGQDESWDEAEDLSNFINLHRLGGSSRTSKADTAEEVGESLINPNYFISRANISHSCRQLIAKDWKKIINFLKAGFIN